LHTEHQFEYQRVADGLKWMAWGMFKKVVIADRMVLFVNPVYSNPGDFQGPVLAFATLAFAIQIYCDFSGYSDIALGSAQVMGVRLMKNFNHPYFAQSISDFWRRWHISLSTWFRDYLYIPLGGNRAGRWRWAFSLMVTFLISGLWHGANWTYVIWGFLHGVFLVFSSLTDALRARMSTLVGLDRLPRLRAALSMLTTFSFVTFAWIFFRAASISDAFYISTNLFDGWRPFLRGSWEFLISGFQGGSPYAILNSIFEIFARLTKEAPPFIFLTLVALFLLIVIEILQYRENLLARLHKHPVYLRQIVYALLIAAILILGTDYASKQQAFIYFQF
jgi:D-alanyl-lipoteichoic acid acyltransferase DltB (MBOAT superfamily)